jgi:hypothetical protein
MLDYYWKSTVPTEIHIDYIYQVKYTMCHFNNKLFEVQDMNIHNGKTSHWVYLLMCYEYFLRSFLFRIEVLMKVYWKYRSQLPKEHKAFMPCLARVLVTDPH